MDRAERREQAAKRRRNAIKRGHPVQTAEDRWPSSPWHDERRADRRNRRDALDHLGDRSEDDEPRHHKRSKRR